MSEQRLLTIESGRRRLGDAHEPTHQFVPPGYRHFPFGSKCGNDSCRGTHFFLKDSLCMQCNLINGLRSNAPSKPTRKTT